MNAYTSPQQTEEAERRARHLSVCQELIDLGLKLARAAAQRALDAHEQSQPDHPADTQNQTQARDPNLAFTRLSASVRHAVALEARIAGNAFARPAPAPHPGTTPDEALEDLLTAADHGALSSALTRLTDHREDRWQLQETLADIIEDTLTTFPDDPLPTHFARACLALNIQPDLTMLPPDLASLVASSPPDRWPRPQPG